uniref:Uncharacterized protein n=1 Tax=Glossina palpalis gambiensis TaxID=67801 RepID=A0A1B0BUP8_9MUSC
MCMVEGDQADGDDVVGISVAVAVVILKVILAVLFSMILDDDVAGILDVHCRYQESFWVERFVDADAEFDVEYVVVAVEICHTKDFHSEQKAPGIMMSTLNFSAKYILSE